MCDGYSQSMQHLRTVAWLERGPLVVWLQEDANLSACSHVQPVARKRPARLARLQASTRSLRQRVSVLRARAEQAGAPSSSVEQFPASR